LLVATVLSLLVVPVFYVVVKTLLAGSSAPSQAEPTLPGSDGA
jgi:hypothetical protein